MKLIIDRINHDKVSLAQLKEAGDDDQIVRKIDHSFTCENEIALKKLADALLLIDFTNLKLYKPEKEDYFLLECTSIDCTEFHSIAKASVLVEILAKHFGVEYDGWGSPVLNGA